MTVARAFRPSFDALAELVAFTAAAFEQEGIDRRLLTVVDFALEELFTNVVKYGDSRADIRVELRAIPGGVEGCLTAEGVADFDVTKAPSADTHLPLEHHPDEASACDSSRGGSNDGDQKQHEQENRELAASTTISSHIVVPAPMVLAVLAEYFFFAPESSLAPREYLPDACGGPLRSIAVLRTVVLRI